MKKAWFALSMWALAGFMVLASLADEGVRSGQRAYAATQRPAVERDPQMRNMGGLTSQYENLGDVIHSGRRFRDVTFYADSATPIEVIALADDEALEIEIFNAEGEPVASVSAPVGVETPVVGAVSAGEGNRIRIRRATERSEEARFRLRVRKPS